MRMGRNRAAAAAILAAAAMPSPGAAADLTARDLLAACRAPGDSTGRAFCNGYVAGFAAGMSVGGALVLINGAGVSSAEEINAGLQRYTGICLEHGEDAGPLSGQIAAWLEARPDALDGDAGTLVVRALHDLHRCAE